MSLIAISPDSGVTLDAVLSSTNLQNWNTWVGSLLSTNVIVDVPRFTSNYGANLNTALTALGMGVAFDPNNADFSAISDIKPLFISFVVHKTAVIVDEQGTTASAATGIGVGSNACPAPPTPEVRLDHPFFYAIRDDKTGTLLFLGKMMDPTATGS
jgi:serpin B